MEYKEKVSKLIQCIENAPSLSAAMNLAEIRYDLCAIEISTVDAWYEAKFKTGHCNANDFETILTFINCA